MALFARRSDMTAASRCSSVDEIGYLLVAPAGGNPNFQLVNASYEKGR